MTRVTATEARRDLFRLLDAIETGEEVVLERKGIRFRLSLEPTEAPAKLGSSPLLIEDPALLSGNWTWGADEEGQLQFLPRT